MRSKIALANFIVLLALGILLLALGWLGTYGGGDQQALQFELHTSVGVVAAAALIIQIALHLAVPAPAYPAHWSRGRKVVAGLSEFLIYFSLFVIVGSGALSTAFGGVPPKVFGLSLPFFSISDRSLAEIAGPEGVTSLRALGLADLTASEALLALHRYFAFVLAGSIIIHLAVGGFTRFRQPREPAPHEASPDEPSPTQGLSARLRIFGWLQLSVQLAIALASGLLLKFSSAGIAFSPSVSGFGDAIYWGYYAFYALVAAVALAVYYTYAARTVGRPDYLARTSVAAFWFLSLGLLVGLAGIVFSFVGVSLSVSLLIAKTVSQPPGIAITDPNKIIRAMDVFVLLVNFILLLGHFIGTSIAAWLAAEASHARYRFAVAPSPEESRA